MPTDDADKLIPLATDRPVWDRFFGVYPLVIVGSKEEDGQYNFAPNPLATMQPRLCVLRPLPLSFL